MSRPDQIRVTRHLLGLRAVLALRSPLNTAQRAIERGGLVALWCGERQGAFAEAEVSGTAAVALLALGRAPDLTAAQASARGRWARRPIPRAA